MILENKPFVQSATITLAKALVAGNPGIESRRDVTGYFVHCIRANRRFEISIDFGSWSTFDQGFRIKVPNDPFTVINFRALATDVDTTVEFIWGSVEFSDSNLAIIRDVYPLIPSVIPPTTIRVPTLAGYPAIAAGVKVTLVGVVNAGGLAHRKSIIVQNQEQSADRIQILSSTDVLLYELCRIGGADPIQHIEIETSDTIKIFNPEVSAGVVLWLETFYQSA